MGRRAGDKPNPKKPAEAGLESGFAAGVETFSGFKKPAEVGGKGALTFVRFAVGIEQLL